jgi:hypothetical protein
MALTSADFHYLTILRELEKETTRLHGRKKASERGQAHRTSRVFRDLFGELSTKVEGANITVKLRASAELLLDTELACAKVLRELTEGRPSLDRLAAGDWPPVVPPARMVERFTALTIGMHSEDPSQPLAVHAARAFHEAVLPALAWGVVSHLYELPEHLREDAQKALAKYFKGKPLPHLAELEVGVDEKLPFLYLRMVEAWFAMLTTAKDSAPWCCSAESWSKARARLATWLAQPLTDLDTRLWSTLGEQYTGQVAGSQRARVVEQAGRHSDGSAGFVRNRLQLFMAANDPMLRKFRLLAETNLDKASKKPFAAEEAKPEHPEVAAHEACGAAFWLARACFAKHVGEQTQNLNADRASERVLLLLVRAAALLKHDPDLRLTCVRYAIGFATNPRYVRSGAVLDNQDRLIDLYAIMPGHRRSLVNLFRGRLAWQQWRAKLAPDAKLALKYYAEALRERADPEHGFDAEAPVHFFPELICLLNQAQKRKGREESTLKAVDFITQRNYGIYFDIETEERMITAGLKEYAEFKAMVRQKLKERGQPKLAASDAREGQDAELRSNYQEAVDELYPSGPDYREYIADLLSMPGVTIRRRR